MGQRYINQPCHKWICVHCLKHGKGMGSCGLNGHKSIWLHHKNGLPSPYANKKTWLAVPIYIPNVENKAIYLRTINRK